MNGSNNLLDTNILLYLVGGEINERDLPAGNFAISFVTELEVLSYSFISEKDEENIKNLLGEILIVDINKEIKGHTIELRKRYKLKLPDAIVAATAVYLKADLVTNDKEFSRVEELKAKSVPIKKG